SEPESHDGDGQVHFHLGKSDDEDRPGSSHTERKSAYYDYQQDRYLKQADAKLVYQHTYNRDNQGIYSPLMRAQTFGGPTISRVGSQKSLASGHWNSQSRVGAPPTGLLSQDK